MKTIGLIVIFIAMMIGATLYGESNVNRGNLCQTAYRLDGTWKPLGWKVEDGFPRTDCTLPNDRITFEDGTWVWK